MRFGILIFSAIVLLFASCDKSTFEEDEEQLRLNDTYHLEKVEFYLDEGDGLLVTEKSEGLTINNWGKETTAGIIDKNTFTSSFNFAENQPYTLVIDTTRKIRVPSLLKENVLYTGQEEVWTFRNREPEERITGTYEHSWNIAALSRTTITNKIKISTINATFNAYFTGKNTNTEVVMQGKWQGQEREHIEFTFVTDEIDK